MFWLDVLDGRRLINGLRIINPICLYWLKPGVYLYRRRDFKFTRRYRGTKDQAIFDILLYFTMIRTSGEFSQKDK